MESTIKKALQKLEEAEYAEFFAELDKIIADMPSGLQNLYHTHKKKFIVEGAKWDSGQQFQVFTKELENYLKGNVSIQDLSEDSITLNVNGEIKKISKTLDSLQKFMKEEQVQEIQHGEKIYNIGEIGQAEFQNITYHTESKTSQSLKVFLYVFVPVLAITLSVVLFLYWQGQEPLSLTVRLKNLSPNTNLALKEAKITLTYGDNSVSKNTPKEATFKGIPSNFKGEKVTLTFESEGFMPIDTSFVLEENNLELPIRRNEDLAKVFGLVQDEAGNPVENVQVSIQDLNTETDKNGRFELQIPFEKQRKEQTIRAVKEGYKAYQRLEPIIKNEETLIFLEK